MSKPIATVTGWYGGHPVIEPMDGWIPAVGRVLYSAPDSLTAAAPDLLEALTLLESTCGEGWLEMNNPIRVLARAAIAKAKGEA